jgi:TRAP-type C4-dicarboxylate transport system permease small subunit
MSLANRKNIGVTYVATTSVLLVAIVGSWQCWQSLNVGHHSTETLHDVCLGIWVVSGALLILSQIVFIGFALGIKVTAVSNTEVASDACLPKPVQVSRKS